MKVETKILEMEYPDEEDSLPGHIVVAYRLFEGDENGMPLCVVDVRTYFTDESVTLAQLKEDAIKRSAESLRLLVEQLKPS
jgi:hypothetical protein